MKDILIDDKRTDLSLAETVADLMGRRPTYYGSKEMCLAVLFGVSGNGFRWHNGRLVQLERLIGETLACSDKNDPDFIETVKMARNQSMSDFLNPKFFCLIELPDDVLPDWREAYNEIKELYEEYLTQKIQNT